MGMTATRLLVGTGKGAFVVASDDDRSTWTVRGPYCDGWPINHVVADPTTGMIWAGGGSEWTGAGVWRSPDGETWELTKLTGGTIDEWAGSDPDFAAMMGWEPTPLPFGTDFQQVWSLARAGDRLYAGTKPARLLVSADDGATWSPVRGLNEHPSSADWSPGGAGLVLHTVLVDPQDHDRLWVAISAAGIFASPDGGATWHRRNDLADSASVPDSTHPAGPANGEVGQCVHHLEQAPGGINRLYQQNHHGTWRSDDAGASWRDITAGLPSTFGFVIQTHPRDPETIWTLPLNSDQGGRFPLDAAAAVWRSGDGGATWQAQRSGLPQQACFFTVLRQAMTGDRQDPAGVYFGTNSGSLFASRDEGVSWNEIARHLPTILSVEVLER